MRPYRVPVLMFHSVGVRHLEWPYAFLSEDLSLFERKIETLIRLGYQPIFHEELYRHLRAGAAIPEKAILLTFDDGYLDNWVIVFPLLKKKQIKFTIYVSQEFVDPAEICRPNLDDVGAGRHDRARLELLGYLSWAEMRAMEASGFVDIQSHTSTHTWQFTGDTIMDYLHPGNLAAYPWMLWNRTPRNKPCWIRALSSAGARMTGLPVYENQRAMMARRHLEDPDLNLRLVDHVTSLGGAELFSRADARERLDAWVQGYRHRERKRGRMETEAAYSSRMTYELRGNKTAIEDALGKQVHYLCWPGGAYRESLLKLAEESGYKATTVKQGYNARGDDPRRVHRISSGNPSGEKRFPWKYPLFTLRYYLDRFHGKPWAVALDRLYRLTAAGV